MSQATEQEMGTLLSIINRADIGQLSRANTAINNRRQVINKVMIGQIRIGSKVQWNGKHGHQTGVVIKVKQKYVEVLADGGKNLHWNVPASMLTAVP